MLLSKELKRRIFKIEYLSCLNQDHQEQQLSFICLDTQCQYNRLLCCYCVNQSQSNKSHKDHQIIAFKDYLVHVCQQKQLCKQQDSRKPAFTNLNPNISPELKNILASLNKQNHEQQSINYLSYLHKVQQQKIKALKQLQSLQSKFNEQIESLAIQIKINAQKYTEKLQALIAYSFGKLNFIQEIQNLTINKDLFKLQGLIQRLIQNFDTPNPKSQLSDQQNNGTKKVLEQNTKNGSKLNTITSKLNLILSIFTNKISSLQKALSKFDLKFIPKLEKEIKFQTIAFTASSKLFEWDLLLKAKNFEMDSQNSKIMRVKVSSSNNERFALMNSGFLPHVKRKFQWAIKINKLVGWIGVGLALKNVISQAQFKFNYTLPNHGSYLISGNAYSWSHFQPEHNSKNEAFYFTTGDTIIMIFDSIEMNLTFKKANQLNASFTLKIAPIDQKQTLCPCVNMCSANDQVEIVAVPKEVC